MKQILFLDLEDTIIESWDNPFLINVSKIKEWLVQHSFDEIRLFSFAVHSERDALIFNMYMKPAIEQVLDVVIHPDIFVTGNEFKKIGKFFMESVTHNELFSEIGKYRSFIAWCNIHFKGNHCVLLDDAFSNETQLLWDSNTQIDFVEVVPHKPLRNVKKLIV